MKLFDTYGPVISCNGLDWVPTFPGVTFDILGYIPTFLSIESPLRASKQIDRSYRHGGGWRPFKGFELEVAEGGFVGMRYPRDPLVHLLYKTKLRKEHIFFYQHQWLRIAQPNGSWEVCRLD